MMGNAEGTPYEDLESQGGTAGEETTNSNETIAAKDPEKEQMREKIHIMKMEIELLSSDFAREKMKWEQEREQLQKELQHYKSTAQKVPDDGLSSKAAWLMRGRAPSKSQGFQNKKKRKFKKKKSAIQNKPKNQQAAKSNQIPINYCSTKNSQPELNERLLALEKQLQVTENKEEKVSTFYEEPKPISKQKSKQNVQKPVVKPDPTIWVEKTALIFQDSLQMQDIKLFEPESALPSAAESEKPVKQEPEQKAQKPIVPPSKPTDSEKNIYFLPMDPIGCLERTVKKLSEQKLEEPSVQPSTSTDSKINNLFLPRDLKPIELPLASFSGVTEQEAPLEDPLTDYARIQLRGQFTLFLLNHVCKIPESQCCIQEFRNSACHTDNCINGPYCDRYICQRIHAKLDHLKTCQDRTRCKFCQSYVYFNEFKWLGMMQLFEQSCPFKTPIASRSQASGREVFMSMVTRLAVNSGMVGDAVQEEEEVVIENDIPVLGDPGDGESFYSASSTSDSDSEYSESDTESSSSSSSSSDSSAGSSWSSCGAGGTSEEYEIVDS